MEIRLFGEVQLWAAGRLLDVGTPRQQVVLAALAVDAGRPVPIETLVDRVWDDTPPVGARNVLYSHLSRIRRLLGKAAAVNGGTVARVIRRHAGYVLDIEPDLVDLHRFRRLAERGRDPGYTDADRSAAVAEALGLWRGTPLSSLPGQWAAQVRRSWHRHRLDATVQWAQVELRLGHQLAVIAVLSDLVADYPLVEPLEALLMRALHSAGRAAEAVDRYAAFRQRLADELGTDPGVELQALHQAILRGELPAAITTAASSAVPAQLPPDVSGFAGRDDELRHLDDLLTAAGAGTATNVVILVIDGTAGVGKTALAVHWAHRVADRFSDGQLYVNLRGFDPTGSPVTPAEAVRGFLDAFEVPPERIPSTVEARVGLYRSLLTGRRVIVLLDNARDAEQIRPLLPGARGCLALATSRNQLGGLVASEGAHPLTLGLLTGTDARQLLTRRIGARRVAAEPYPVNEIVALCSGLPLALAIVAGRAASHPGFSLAALAGELREAQGRLDAFATADLATDVRAVFSWSYRQLSPAAARMFRLLGLHPGPDVAAPAAASLAGAPPGRVRRILAELARVHLVAEHLPGRYALHDLLRAYAMELVKTGAERRVALRRMLDHYLCTAHAAALLLNPHRHPITVAPPPGVTAEELADSAQAFTWFAAEHPVLLAAIQQAAAGGFDTHAWQLAWTLTTFLDRRGLWHEWADTQTAALDAARRLADHAGQARAHRSLAGAYTRLGRYDDTHTHLRHALDRYRELGDHAGQAHVHRDLGWVLGRQGRYAAALDHARQALEMFRAAGHLAGQARALNAVGWYHARLGEHRQALTYCEQALALHQEIGNRAEEAHTWDSLGYVHHHLGHRQQAIVCYQHAIALHRETGDRYYEADTLANLGDTYQADGDADAARQAWQRALVTLDQLGHADAGPIREKLRRLGMA